MSAVIDLPGAAVVARRLAAVAAAGASVADRRTLFVVVREPDLPVLATGLRQWLAILALPERQAWLANFTKVRLLAGNPARPALAALLSHVEGGTLGFALVDAEARHSRLGDLLVPLRSMDGPAPGTALDLAWGEGPGRWLLEVDVTGLDWPRYLVQVLHLLAEAALDDAGFGGRITLRHQAGPPACGPDVLQLRLDTEASPPACRAVLRPWRDVPAA